MLSLNAAARLDQHGTGDYAAAHFPTIQPPGPTAGSLPEIGRAPIGWALRWGRHHLRWRSIGVAEIGGAQRHRAAPGRLFRGLPQARSDRASAVGSDHAARVRAGA